MLKNDTTLNRDSIQQLYIDWYLEGASLSELQEAVAMQMSEDLDLLDDDELVTEVKHYAPELFEGPFMKEPKDLIIDEDQLVVYATVHGWTGALALSHKIKQLYPDYTLNILSKENFNQLNAQR